MTESKSEEIYNRFREGDTVQIIDLQTEKYNGQLAQVVGPYLIDTDRWPIQLYNDNKDKLAIKPMNLKRQMSISYKPAYSSGVYGSYTVPAQQIKTYRFAAIADQDKQSRAKDNKYKSYLQHGSIKYDTSANQLIEIEWTKPFDNDFKFEFDPETNAVVLTTNIATSKKHRGAELSALAKRNNAIFTACDKTGIIYEISSQFTLNVIGKLIKNNEHKLESIALDQLNDENMHENGYKIEWMTSYKGDPEVLCVGSTSQEFVDSNTKKVTNGMSWIAEFSVKQKSVIKTTDWINNFNLLRKAIGAVFPGWMHLECVLWSDINKKWFVLPRRVCINAPYDHLNNNYGANLLLIASADFSEVKYVHIKLQKPENNNVKYVESLYTDQSAIGEEKVEWNEVDFEGAQSAGVLTTNDISDKDELRKLQVDVSKSLFYEKDGAEGFSSAVFMPDTNDNVIIGVRTSEKGKKLTTSFCIFDVDGNVFVEKDMFKGNRKYEGLCLL